MDPRLNPYFPVRGGRGHAADLAARRDALKAGLGQGERFLGGASAAISGAELQRLPRSRRCSRCLRPRLT